MKNGCNKNRWLPHHLTRLEQMIEAGASYEEAAVELGHSEQSCRTVMSDIRSRRRGGEAQQLAGNGRNRWEAREVETLERLIESGTGYDVAALAVGHPVSSCQTKMSEIRSARREAERQKPGEIAARMASPLPAVTPAAEPRGRTTSTAKLMMDAELRARIEILGPTGGMLGDPLPGRSALDRKRQGANP